ncbi:hypothetical protein GCM10010530_49440 [Kribbella aluminosa]
MPLPSTHLLTVTEYAALGEADTIRSEQLVLSPGPSPDHNIAP